MENMYKTGEDHSLPVLAFVTLYLLKTGAESFRIVNLQITPSYQP